MTLTLTPAEALRESVVAVGTALGMSPGALTVHAAGGNTYIRLGRIGVDVQHDSTPDAIRVQVRVYNGRLSGELLACTGVITGTPEKLATDARDFEALAVQAYNERPAY